MIAILNFCLFLAVGACIGLNFAALRVLAMPEYRRSAMAWRALGPICCGFVVMTAVLLLLVEP